MKQGKPRPCPRCKGTGVDASETERATIPKPVGGVSNGRMWKPTVCKQCDGRKIVQR